MDTKRKIGIMGGTFDPVHIVHMILAENAYRDFSLDEVMFLPDGDPPHKKGRHISSAADRIAMLRIAVGDIQYFNISDMEIKRTGYSYSSDTLLELHRDHPDTDYYFIMGGDSLFQIEQWHEPAVVMANSIIIAAVRDNYDSDDFDRQREYLMKRYDADIRKLEIPELDISSSDLRGRCMSGKSIKFMVPDGVDEYIISHKLYD